jgi:hypothetical protein
MRSSENCSADTSCEVLPRSEDLSITAPTDGEQKGIINAKLEGQLILAH